MYGKNIKKTQMTIAKLNYSKAVYYWKGPTSRQDFAETTQSLPLAAHFAIGMYMFKTVMKKLPGSPREVSV